VSTSRVSLPGAAYRLPAPPTTISRVEPTDPANPRTTPANANGSPPGSRDGPSAETTTSTSVAALATAEMSAASPCTQIAPSGSPSAGSRRVLTTTS
jgi:hypothetical protein